MDSSPYKNRIGIINSCIASDIELVKSLGVPGICLETYRLAHTVFKKKCKFVFYQLRAWFSLGLGRHFDKDTQAVTFVEFYIVGLIPDFSTKIFATHIDTESTLVAALQTHRSTTQSSIVAIVDPK